MSDTRAHNTYDEVAAELGAAARRLMAPALLAARKAREGVEADNAKARGQLAQRGPFTRAAEQHVVDGQVRARIDAARDTAER